MRARSIDISEIPLGQAEIVSRHSARALQGQDLDAVVFSLQCGRAPIPEIVGSGFRIALDLLEGVSAFAHAEMRRLLALQQQLWSGRS